MKIIAYTWFQSTTTVGIIVCQNEKGEFKSYIGCGEGVSPEYDLVRIKESGCHFPLIEGVTLCKIHGTTIDYESFNLVKGILDRHKEVGKNLPKDLE